MTGRIELICGPMFSGKSTELLRRANRFLLSQHSVLVIKYHKDNRYSEMCVATHDKTTMKAISCAKLLSPQMKAKIADNSVIAIDEGQFFPDLVDFCELAACSGCVVMVAALDADFLRRPFAQIAELIPKAEKIDKLTAICKECFKEASFSFRKVDSDALELIGSKEVYIPVCRHCYFELQREKESKRAMKTKISSAKTQPRAILSHSFEIEEET
ncbi:Thymidine kinase like protein [Aduncisulcus paluster]|uniref:Thymidine kinase n=1 Tax=Aduncisulcus paluster TaxID=2918883 RepID=A0ABQ5KMV9_9EUKA|nr:Thymidine kinase like protein [Aduncisulcus paluster]|eukprot:gnl/Carplike_NY0171/8793_a12222_134.p1 GENE.gnl/Carplike_NY0171/8793_a12222_134~~gnl/Carplike_NY0171/8793_a12222_134.p1  ORF type:complete len:215 (+),score=36.34 gnl/Carplike_NY0171/8793_a12222_134:31-675(+)